MGCLLLAEHLEWFPTERALVSDAYWNIKQVYQLCKATKSVVWKAAGLRQAPSRCSNLVLCGLTVPSKDILNLYLRTPAPDVVHWRSYHLSRCILNHLQTEQPPEGRHTDASRNKLGRAICKFFSPWNRSLCKGQSGVSTHLQSKVLNVSAYKCFHNKEM